MPKVSKADTDIRAMIADLIGDRYPLLATARIGCLMADDVKEFGQFVPAKVKVNNEADRLDGKPDFTITIDRANWNILGLQIVDGPKQRLGILETMLHSLEVRTYPNGEVMTDDEGRPLAEKRPADWFLVGYAAMARRYGPNSLEVIQATRLREEFGELLFGFMDSAEGSDVARDTFAALIAVGHTEDQAREAIDVALAGGEVFGSVAEMVDAIYLQRRQAEPETDVYRLPKFTPGLKLFGCNRCHVNRTRDVPLCPACLNPEFSLLVVNGELKAVKDEEALAELKSNGRKSRKAEAVEVRS